MSIDFGRAHVAPPAFDETGNLRYQARSAGLDPNFWYAVEIDRNLKRNKVVEVRFWGESIALYRDEHGDVHALLNRCVHRQLKLSLGEVRNCTLVCPYHGWAYDGTGQVVDIPHDLFNRNMPKFRVPNFPVQIRYGLIWIFPGDPEIADKQKIPDIPELEGENRWACVPIAMTWRAHHSMVIDNVSDFTHQYLHRKYRPFVGAKLLRYETNEDEVILEYDAEIGRGRISGLFVDRKQVRANRITLGYRYPYQWSNTDDHIKHWLFVLPVDKQTTRSFFLFYFKSLKIPMLPFRVPYRLMSLVLRISNRLLIKPILKEDGIAVEAEQEGYEQNWQAQFAELNPVVRAFQTLTVRKWQNYLGRVAGKIGTKPPPPERILSPFST
jgi:phenylpropionate dioxygenase-like ring-hydroxylating dioxygenase large terminal subunit